MTATATAPAKINLTLLAGPPRPDGFHPLLTVFQAVDLLEQVTVAPGERPGVAVELRGLGQGQVPLGPSNLAVRAVTAVAQAAGVAPVAVALTILKQVPVAGGLAGGSADAAAALVAANRHFGAGLTRAELHALAAGLGSDVNFCLEGGAAIGRGRGEQLEPVPARGPLHWVLATRPGMGLSTPQVFAALDAARAGRAAALPPRPPQELLDALAQGDPRGIGRHLVNDLQGPAMAAMPELGRTVAAALAAGATGAVVSGSGPTVAALSPDAATAQAIAQAVEADSPAVHAVQCQAPAPGTMER